MTIAEVHTLTGAYVLDAVTDLERVEFDRHLKDCPACAEEVHELQETAARLGSAAAEAAPPELFDRVMAQITVTRQLPPRTSDLFAGRARPSRRWVRRAAIGVASIAAAAAVLVGGISLGHQNTQQVAGRASGSSATSTLTAGDLVTVTAPGVSGGSVTASVSREQGEVVVSVRDLAALDSSRAYQVWLTGPRGAQSAGLLHPGDGSGTVSAAIPTDVTGVTITTEPAAGSPQPTTVGTAVLTLGQ
jgi:anti-sigma factor RsiW